MKKVLATALAAILAAALCGCKSDESTITGIYEDTEDGRFYVEYEQTISPFDGVAIIVDTETGYKYLLFDGYESGGLCRLEDAN